MNAFVCSRNLRGLLYNVLIDLIWVSLGYLTSPAGSPPPCWRAPANKAAKRCPSTLPLRPGQSAHLQPIAKSKQHAWLTRVRAKRGKKQCTPDHTWILIFWSLNLFWMVRVRVALARDTAFQKWFALFCVLFGFCSWLSATDIFFFDLLSHDDASTNHR